MVIEIRVDINDAIEVIDSAIKINERKEKESLVALGNDFIKNAKANLKPGKLQRSIGNPAEEGIYVLIPHILLIGTEVPYCVHVERGVPHRWLIPKKPKPKGEWLKFYWEKVGHYIYAKQVIHPPMQGKWYMTRAANKTAKNAPKILEKI